MSMIRNINIQEFGLQSSALQTEEATQNTSLPITAILCDQLAQLSIQATAAASTAASVTPTNPEEDPNFNTEIPYKIVDGKKVVDFSALLEQLNHIMNYLRCNHMSFAGLKEAADFLFNIGSKAWGSLSEAQKAVLKPILNQKIEGSPAINFFGMNIKITSLGELAGYASVFEVFYKTSGTIDQKRQAALDFLSTMLGKLQGMGDFMSQCDFLANFKKALDALNAITATGHRYLEDWMTQHTKNGQAIDDSGDVCTYQQWILDCQGYMGLLLKSSDFGSYDHNGVWQKIYYKTLINHFWEEFKNCHDPMLLLAMLFTILENQNDDREDEIAGASQPGSYLAIVGQVNAKVVSLLTQGKANGSFSVDDVRNFLQYLEDIKRYVNDDADIGDDLKKAFGANLDTFLKISVGPYQTRDWTIEELWKTDKSDAAIQVIATHGFNPALTKDAGDYGKALWTQMTNALSGVSDQCKEQSSISGTMVNSMTNTLNQCYATLKNLYDAFINLEQAYVRNEQAK